LNPPGRLLSIEDVERETSLSQWTIRRWIRAGKFPKPKPLGARRVVWTERDVEAWKREALGEAESTA
jgi:prophage regulatory protein